MDVEVLVDTSVLSGPPLDDDEVHFAASVVTIGELEAGVLLARDASVGAERLRRLMALLAETPVLGIDRRVASRYAELRAGSGRRPSNDLWIAATALAHDLTLVTRDQGQASLPGVATRMVG